MRLVALFVFFVCLVPSAWAQSWTHNGATWSHKNGISVSFPADFQVSVDKSGHLSGVAKSGFLSFTLSPAQGKKEMKEVMSGIEQTMLAAKVTRDPKILTGKQNGLDVAFQDGTTTNKNGVELHVRLGIFNSKAKDAYLLLQMIVPEQKLTDWEPLYKKVLDSVK